MSLDSQVSQEPSVAQPSMAEMLEMFHTMRSEFETQRAHLEQKVNQLQAELEQVRQRSTISENSVKPPVTTTRRKMLKKLVAGAAGAATLGVISVNQTLAATGSGNIDFNGTGGTPSAKTNAAAGTTSFVVDSVNYTSAVPLLNVNNNSTVSSSGSDPNSLPVGILAQSATSFAIYGISQGSGSSPTGIMGVSSSANLVGSTGSAFFANQVAGVVGASDVNKGIAGLSTNDVGVNGLSSNTAGVQGLSEFNVGGAFATRTSDPLQGASLRLGLRTELNGAPNNSTYSHSAGEFVLDKWSRVFVCNAGYQAAGAAAVKPRTLSTAFPAGPVNPKNSTWKFLTPMIIRTVAPNNPFNNDTDLHVSGEMWVNSTTGITYVCTQTGAYNNDALLATAQVTAGTLPVFQPVGGNAFQLLSPNSDRYVDTRPASATGSPLVTSPLPSVVGGAGYPFTLAGQAGSRNGIVIPTGISAVYGNVTIETINPDTTTGDGGLKIVPGSVTDYSKGTAVIAYKYGPTLPVKAFANSFISRLDSNGQIKVVLLNFGGNAHSVNVIIDIFGYYL